MIYVVDTSLLERLLTYDVYKKNSTTNKYNEKYITKLLNNYRSHPKIIKISNKLFYENELKYFGGKDTYMLENWESLINKKVPIIFHEVNSQEEKEVKSPRYPY